MRSDRLAVLLALSGALALAACTADTDASSSSSGGSSSGVGPSSSSSGTCGNAPGVDPIKDGLYTNVDPARPDAGPEVERTLMFGRAAGTVTVRFVRDGKQIEERWRIKK